MSEIIFHKIYEHTYEIETVCYDAEDEYLINPYTIDVNTFELKVKTVYNVTEDGNVKVYSVFGLPDDVYFNNIPMEYMQQIYKQVKLFEDTLKQMEHVNKGKLSNI